MRRKLTLAERAEAAGHTWMQRIERHKVAVRDALNELYIAGYKAAIRDARKKHPFRFTVAGGMAELDRRHGRG